MSIVIMTLMRVLLDHDILGNAIAEAAPIPLVDVARARGTRRWDAGGIQARLVDVGIVIVSDAVVVWAELAAIVGGAQLSLTLGVWPFGGGTNGAVATLGMAECATT